MFLPFRAPCLSMGAHPPTGEPVPEEYLVQSPVLREDILTHKAPHHILVLVFPETSKEGDFVGFLACIICYSS